MNLLRMYIREALEVRPVRMKLDMSIPPDLRTISDMFRSAGEELYIVGGAVRDTLLNKTPKDYDLATGAAPEAVIDIVSKDPGNKVDLTGKSFGVVRVWTPEGNEYEIATFRKDIGSGRRPDAVEFTSIEDDVKRRDLTINALFYDMDSGEVVDYVGGIEDIKSGVVKAVGDPMQRFQEDKLRILRAARFAAHLGSDLDPETEAAILNDNDLTDVSPDRIRDEVIRGIASAKNVGHFLELLRNLDLYDQIFPGLQVDQNTGANTKDAPVQLALMLGTNDPNQVKSVLKRMKYSNDEVAAVAFFMKFPEITKDSAPTMKKEFNRIKMDSGRLQEFAPSANVSQKTVDSFLKFASAPPAANPRDLMSQGLAGPEIGIAMQSAESDAYGRMLGELREYIRELLTEVAKDVKDLGSKVVVLHDRGNVFSVSLHAYKIEGEKPFYYNKDMLGTFEAQKFGGCSGAYTVRWAEAPHGWGPLLYDVAMEYATMMGGGLISDRTVVSSDASGVWDYYYNNRDDVDYDQLDDYEGHLTPDDKSDDCNQEIVYTGEHDTKRQSWDEEYGDDESWEKSGKDILLRSPLSKVYRWGGYSVMDDLRNAGKLVML